jgi:hypothetical protein
MIAHLIHPEDVEVAKPHQYYPDLFESGEEDEAGRAANELALHKARMEEYAFRYNRARKRGDDNGRNDTGEAPSNNRGTDQPVHAGDGEGAEDH